MNKKLLQFFEDSLLDIQQIGLKLLYCILIIIVCALIIKISRHMIHKFFDKQAQLRQVPLDQRKANTLNSISASLVKYIIYFIGLFTILTYLGIDSKSLLAIAGAGSVALGLGAQKVVQDMLDGFFILFEDHFGVGDVVMIQDKMGTVEALTLRTTKIRDANGAVHIIPNGEIGMMTNMSREFINAVVDVDVDYDEDTAKVIAILKDEMEKTKDIAALLSPPEVLGVAALNESAVTIRIVAQCQVKENYAVERELRLRVKARLDKERIAIPFPQRTIHIVNAEKKE